MTQVSAFVGLIVLAIYSLAYAQQGAAPPQPEVSPPTPGPEIRMTPELLVETIGRYAEIKRQGGNLIEFEYEQILLLCVFDVAADRMRIISEILEAQHIPSEQLLLAMEANFHSALDARYAIGNGVLHAAYIHPLSSLTVAQLESAVRQVATLSSTFGTTYSSGELFFPGGQEMEEDDQA